MSNSDPKYWTGPYGVLVPNEIFDVVAEDGCNTLSKDGLETEMFSMMEMNEAKYKQLYAIYDNNDGKWYYKLPTPRTRQMDFTKSDDVVSFKLTNKLPDDLLDDFLNDS